MSCMFTQPIINTYISKNTNKQRGTISIIGLERCRNRNIEIDIYEVVLTGCFTVHAIYGIIFQVFLQRINMFRHDSERL